MKYLSKDKRGQLLSEPFFWIFALVVLAVIFVAGYVAINHVLEAKELVEYRVLKEDIESRVDDIYSSGSGTMNAKGILVPSNIRAICFADPGEQMGLESLEYDDVRLVMQVSGANVFYSHLSEADIPDGVTTYYLVPHLKPAKNPLCFKTIGSLEARWVNRGRHVEISER